MTHRSPKERAVYRIEQLLLWKYGEKSGHLEFAQQIVDDLEGSKVMSLSSGDALRWPIQPEGIGQILTEALNIPEIATKIAKAIQTGNY